MFISDSHSDGTHSLMQRHISPALMKKQAHLRWTEDESVKHTVTSVVRLLHSVELLDVLGVLEPQMHPNEVLLSLQTEFSPGFGVRQQFRHRALC